jgi:hypothetical protein
VRGDDAEGEQRVAAARILEEDRAERDLRLGEMSRLEQRDRLRLEGGRAHQRRKNR